MLRTYCLRKDLVATPIIVLHDMLDLFIRSIGFDFKQEPLNSAGGGELLFAPLTNLELSFDPFSIFCAVLMLYLLVVLDSFGELRPQLTNLS
jgi:hypothetical protein